MEETTKKYYVPCTHRIASQLLAGQPVGTIGMVDVYLFQKDAFNSRHLCDDCLIELELVKEYLKHETISGISAMVSVDYLVPCLSAIYPMAYVANNIKNEDSSNKCECKEVGILPAEENLEDSSYKVVCCKCESELFRGTFDEANEFSDTKLIKYKIYDKFKVRRT